MLEITMINPKAEIPKIIAPYGTWTSPITAEMTTGTSKSSRNCHIIVRGEDIYWTESRPSEKGRTVIIHRSPDGTLRTVTPPGYDVRSKVNEYGGLSYTELHGSIYFVNAKDQRLYVQTPQEDPKPLTAPGLRFADLQPTSAGIFAIAEEHLPGKVDTYLVLINPSDGHVTTLERNHDFYAAPSLSPDGKKLAWITWDNPNMPWDGTQLWMADFENGKLNNTRHIAGGPNESVLYPQWSPLGRLFFVSDKSGWWNLYSWNNGASQNICPKNAEFGEPLWQLGASTWRFTGRDEEIICTFQEKGVYKLALLNPLIPTLEQIDLKHTDYSQLATGKDFVVVLMGAADKKRRLVRIDLDPLKAHTLDKNEGSGIDHGFLSMPELIEFPSANKRKAYGYYYEPKNKLYKAPNGTLPPLMVMSHGGPTASADPTFNLRVQYWTSRGWAVLDVNYGGSTGYGRAYRESLKGLWGIVDVQDCTYGAEFLAKQDRVDAKKLVIRGGSAGGYTTLAALAFTKTFCAGASYYGVADLELLAKDTHKFEAYYLDSLIGPYPEQKGLYQERSPLNHADKISCPVIFFQGGQDKIVPLNQSMTMYEALKKRGIKTKLVVYEQEEHGFRSAENTQDAMEQEQRFYLEVFDSSNF